MGSASSTDARMSNPFPLSLSRGVVYENSTVVGCTVSHRFVTSFNHARRARSSRVEFRSKVIIA